MTERRTLISNADGVRRTIVTDSLDPNAFTILVEQDVTEIRAGIARDREVSQVGKVNKKLATLPTFVFEDLKRRGVVDDEDRFTKWLNGPACREWKIWEGTV